MSPDQRKKHGDDLFAAFGLAVFELRDDGLFDPAGRLPPWLLVDAGPVDLAHRFPALKVVSDGAAGESVVWAETDEQGDELCLQAVAAEQGGRRFVAIRSLPRELLEHSQLARELELKRRELDRATQAKSEFLAGMSHEIRTPLNAIIGMADVLSLTSLTAEQRKCVEVFQRNAVVLLNLINDVLDLSTVEAGHVEMEAVYLDLGEVVSRAIQVVEQRAAAKGLWLRQSIAADVPRLLVGDPNRLRQVLVNLLGNSIKFTDRGGLEIRVERDPENSAPGRLRFAVTDTGIGIPAEKLGTIFESFAQADSSTTRRYGGPGLGLTISKHLVELMDGRIQVESTLGEGSTFFFTVGLGVPERKPQSPAPKADTPVPPIPAGLRILLVDDSDDNRLLIQAYLKHTNASIDTAENGLIAADSFRARCYDLVLMDVEMPVMDGYDAVREIRRIEKETGAFPTPVLALTAHALSEVAERGMTAGFTEMLTKPIRHATLLRAVAKYAAAPVLVQMDPELADVTPGYLEKRRGDLTVYRQAAADGDFETIREHAHKMKGTGTGYGFPRLTVLGSALEQAARQKDPEAVGKNLNELATYLERVRLR
jgi:signal transduction histidine kinase/AmiR/NasT family two-component response regulator